MIMIKSNFEKHFVPKDSSSSLSGLFIDDFIDEFDTSRSGDVFEDYSR